MNNRRLNNIVKHAYETVPYYHRLFDEMNIDAATIWDMEGLEKIPVLHKHQIQNHPGIFVSSKSLAFPNSERLFMMHTSGSTGKILKVYWSKDDMVKSLLSLWLHRNKNYSISPASKFCTFHSAINEGFEITSPQHKIDSESRQLSFSKIMTDDKEIMECYKKMMDFQPEWILAQPSMIYLIADFIATKGLDVPKSLRYIELSGEFLFDAYRKKIAETFKVPVGNMYGCIESNGIAMECEKGNLHCLTDNNIVEIIRNGRRVPEGEEGEVHITSLNNKTMPFIRYALGDRAVLNPACTCSCGKGTPVIKLLAGRLGQNITLDGKPPVNSFVFYYVIETINAKLENPIMQFQVIQESKKDFRVMLALESNCSEKKDAIVSCFINEASKVGLRDLNWKFEFYDGSLPVINTGKLHFFINKLEAMEE